jgi:hypothetical protein
MKNPFLFFGLILYSFYFSACEPKNKICPEPTELTGKNHLVDISGIIGFGFPELLDTINKYPNLQAYRIVTFPSQGSASSTQSVQFNIFYKNLPVFTSHYDVTKGRNGVSSFGSPIADSINLNLTPTITAKEAIRIAKHQTKYFNNNCFTYRLGIYDLNSGYSYRSKFYKLVWSFKAEYGVPRIILDAHTGEIYFKVESDVKICY